MIEASLVERLTALNHEAVWSSLNFPYEEALLMAAIVFILWVSASSSSAIFALGCSGPLQALPLRRATYIGNICDELEEQGVTGTMLCQGCWWSREGYSCQLSYLKRWVYSVAVLFWPIIPLEVSKPMWVIEEAYSVHLKRRNSACSRAPTMISPGAGHKLWRSRRRGGWVPTTWESQQRDSAATFQLSQHRNILVVWAVKTPRRHQWFFPRRYQVPNFQCLILSEFDCATSAEIFVFSSWFYTT